MKTMIYDEEQKRWRDRDEALAPLFPQQPIKSYMSRKTIVLGLLGGCSLWILIIGCIVGLGLLSACAPPEPPITISDRPVSGAEATNPPQVEPSLIPLAPRLQRVGGLP